MRARKPKGLDALGFDVLIFIGLYCFVAACMLCVHSVLR